jgi:ribosomal protein S10
MYSYQLKISTNNVEDFSFIEKRFPTKVKIVVLPRKRKKFVFIRSPHVNKKSKEHFQILDYRRVYYSFFSLNSLKEFLSNIPNSAQVCVKCLT